MRFPLPHARPALIFSFVALNLLAPSVARAVTPGFGALGDSYADEYQFYPPDRSTARNFVEILSALRGLNFGNFTTQDLTDPRAQGFDQNWALTNATTDDLTPQAAGLAGQVAMGKVQYALVFVGGDDFRNALTGGDASVLSTLPQHMVGNVQAAITTVLAASADVKVVVANVPDIALLPEAKFAVKLGLIPPAFLQAASATVSAYDAALASAFANDPRVAVLDVNGLQQQLLSQPLVVGGVPIDTASPADRIDHLFLADGVHIGTVGQGLLANAYVNKLDATFNAGIKPLTDAEILDYAKRAQAVPLPQAWEMIAAAGAALAAAGYRKAHAGRSVFHTIH